MCAARMFHDLLVLQTGGYVCMQQHGGPYGDIAVTEGAKLAACNVPDYK